MTTNAIAINCTEKEIADRLFSFRMSLLLSCSGEYKSLKTLNRCHQTSILIGS